MLKNTLFKKKFSTILTVFLQSFFLENHFQSSIKFFKFYFLNFFLLFVLAFDCESTTKTKTTIQFKMETALAHVRSWKKKKKTENSVRMPWFQLFVRVLFYLHQVEIMIQPLFFFMFVQHRPQFFLWFLFYVFRVWVILVLLGLLV